MTSDRTSAGWAALVARWGSAAERTAFRFTDESGRVASYVTYADLDTRARAVAARLSRDSVTAPVLLLFPTGVEFLGALFGCLYAGVPAVPVGVPSRHPRGLERLAVIARDCAAALVLTTGHVRARVEGEARRAAAFGSLACLQSSELDPAAGADWDGPVPEPGSLALLQYTSGSTSTPRGVMVTQSNLMHNSAAISACFGTGEDTCIVSWLPVFHDMGLAGSVLQTVFCGGSGTLMSPGTFARDPAAWLRAVSDTGGTVSGGPNFAYERAVAAVTPERRGEFDLSRWSVAFTGAEPVRGDTMRRFAAAFAPSGFRADAFTPCYGLAEATLMVSTRRPGVPVQVEPGPDAGTEVVGCGTVVSGHRVEIVEPDRKTPCAPGETGEVWFRGPSVAGGYWRQPELTDELFGAHLAGNPAPFLRTGDLGYLRDGQLFITGRRKDLIIIRGRNHYPQDIEHTAELSHPALVTGGGAAFAMAAPEGDRLVVVHEAQQQADAAALGSAAHRVRVDVAAVHDVRPAAVVLIRAGTLPRTSSGKVRRAECRRAYLAGDLTVLHTDGGDAPDNPAGAAASGAPDTGPLATLRRAAAEMLGVPPTDIPLDEPLTALGLDSIELLRLHHRIRGPVGRTLDETMAASLRELAAMDDDAAAVAPDAGALPASASGDFPLSRGQASLWFLDRYAPGSSAYVISAAARIVRSPSLDRLDRALRVVSARHAALRTTFPLVDGEPVQRVHASLPPEFVDHDAAGWDDTALTDRIAAFVGRPFDIAVGPLIRVGVFRRDDGDDRLAIAVHHLVADLWSMDVLVRELAAAWSATGSADAPDAGPADAAFAACAAREPDAVDGPAGDRAKRYWRAQLRGAPARLTLPATAAPNSRRLRGRAIDFTVPAAVTDRLRALARTRGGTLHSALLAAYQVVLAEWSGQRDIVLRCPVHGRDRAAAADIVGYFLNTVMLRTRVDRERPFRAAFDAAQRTVSGAVGHAGLPFEAIVERLRAEGEPVKQPSMQAGFLMYRPNGPNGTALAAFGLGRPGARLAVGDLELESLPTPRTGAPFEIAVAVADLYNGLIGSVIYDVDVFDEKTATAVVGAYERLLAAVSENPDAPLSEVLDRLGPGPAQMTVARPVPRTTLAGPLADAPATFLPRLLADQAAAAPNAPAVRCGDRRLTSREVQTRAARLADRLAAAGVGPGATVAIALPRSVDLVIAALAIWRRGAAYLPVDPDHPQARTAQVLADARPAAVIADPSTWPASEFPLVTVDDAGTEPAAPTAPAPVHAGSPAYVIYTSGSTGRPKGVVIGHAALANLIADMCERFQMTAADRLLAVTTFSFDIAALELFAPLAVGAEVVVAGTWTARDPIEFAAAVTRHNVTIMQATPSHWRILLEAPECRLDGIRVLCGGEPLRRPLANELSRRAAEVVNLYGPTETTIWSTGGPVAPDDSGDPDIGEPIRDTRVYVLDAALRPVAPAVPGELYLAGGGLANGYLGRPGLTAERFVADPFGPPGSRMYRTGDIGRVRPDGRLECLGRADRQVKIRGHRVELGDIESVLASHPTVEMAAVVAVSAPGIGTRLVAYVTTRGNDAPESQKLRAEVSGRLPDYMVPSAATVLDALPISSNGKINHRALEDLAAKTLGTGPDASTIAPAGTATGGGDIQATVCGIVARLLEIGAVTLDEELLDIGWHSLATARLSVHLGFELGIDVPVPELMNCRTVGDLVGQAEMAAAWPRPAIAPIRPADRSQRVLLADADGRPRLPAAFHRPAASGWPPTARR